MMTILKQTLVIISKQHLLFQMKMHQKEQLHPYSNCCSITIGYQKQLNKSAFQFKILVPKLNTISKMLTKLGYAWLLGAVNGGFNLVFVRKMRFIYASVLKYFCYIFNYISCK
ncbi:uncharacterized protein LOC124819285 isoform X1 [Hydra vulgaris]|uniref:uncharacterized protein LOC124819285 isoform X1 n=1 Tax=Hydra vulgaris TaxID=6087 RepID=UPI0032EA8F10